jgi:hypothetical protein
MSTGYRLVRTVGLEIGAGVVYGVTMVVLAVAMGPALTAGLAVLVVPAVLKGWFQLVGATALDRRSVHLVAMFATVGVIVVLWVGFGDTIEDLSSTLNATSAAVIVGVLGVVAMIAWPLAILVYAVRMLVDDATSVGFWYYPWTVFVSIGVLFWSTVIVRVITGA